MSRRQFQQISPSRHLGFWVLVAGLCLIFLSQTTNFFVKIIKLLKFQLRRQVLLPEDHLSPFWPCFTRVLILDYYLSCQSFDSIQDFNSLFMTGYWWYRPGAGQQYTPAVYRMNYYYLQNVMSNIGDKAVSYCYLFCAVPARDATVNHPCISKGFKLSHGQNP